jgi:alpha-beta hydrolase superfamily lysophospholipase
VSTFAASDGHRWHYRHYPADRSHRRVVYLHGIQSHGGWYHGSCSHLANAGFDVYFLDRRGSGLNEESRGDMPSFRRLLDDIAEFVHWLKTEKGEAKTTLLAVSWGGKLATAFQKRHPGLVDAMGLLCPGFRPQVKPGFFRRLRILFTRLIRPRKLFSIPLSDPELFTATPRWLEFLRQDKLAIHEATARFFVQNFRLDLYTRRARKHVRIPWLLMLAGKDRIIDNEKTREYVSKFGGTGEIIEYLEAHHTLEFEPDPSRFLDDLTRWLLARRAREGGASPHAGAAG